MVIGAHDIVAGGGFAGRAPGVIAQVLKFTVSPAIDTLVTQWLVVTGALGNAKSAITPEFAPIRKAGGIFNQSAKDQRTNGTNAGNLAHTADFGEAAGQTQGFLERSPMLGQSLCVALIQPPHHALFFGSFETGDPFFLVGRREEGFAVELDNAPLPEAGFDVGLGFTTLIPAFEEFAHEMAEDFPMAIGAYPHRFEMSEGKERAKRAHIRFIALVGIGGDELIEARFTNHKLIDMWA